MVLWIYFADWVTDRFVRVPVSGGSAELFDEPALGALRDMARDPTTIYWIGAGDGTALRSMPSGGGTMTTIFTGLEL